MNIIYSAPDNFISRKSRQKFTQCSWWEAVKWDILIKKEIALTTKWNRGVRTWNLFLYKQTIKKNPSLSLVQLCEIHWWKAFPKCRELQYKLSCQEILSRCRDHKQPMKEGSITCHSGAFMNLEWLLLGWQSLPGLAECQQWVAIAPNTQLHRGFPWCWARAWSVCCVVLKCWDVG